MTSESLNIVTINGSARPGNFTGKALAVAQTQLDEMDDIAVTIIEPATLNLAIPGMTNQESKSSEMRAKIKAADGVILATPEYHGSFSSLIKISMENMGFPSALKDKPVVLLGVASGAIGAVKSLEHLRSVCVHVGALVLPGSVSVPNVQSIFDEAGNCNDPQIEKRIRRLSTGLVQYIRETRCPKVSIEEMMRRDQKGS